ncbi:MAG: hypothetical protein DRI57_06215 [Deltaproteobacteria bacterium]|nr:MAG: hypothetical protein DRI57_06215 [Deltaproteobacteria bacterium]
MPSQGRLGDKSRAMADKHGCPACPHPVIGPGIMGSPNVFVNSLPALRVDDWGIHAPCCGLNMWKAVKGSATVFINGKAAHRMGDKDKHCGGDGKLVEGSRNVFVGDSGGGPAKCACDQAQLMKDAAKSGTPFFEGAMTALEKAKQAAVAKAKQAAQDMLVKPVKSLIDKGLKGAQEQREKEKKGPELKDPGLAFESKEGYTDPEAQDSIKIGYQVEDKFYDDQLLYYGNENANIKVGHAEASKGFGYAYDLEKDEHEFTLGQLKGKASVIEGEYKDKALKGLVETTVKGEVLSVAGEVTLPSVTVSKEKVEVKAKVGVEANLVKGEAEGKINITPKTIYDNTVGSVVGWFSPKSKFASAPKWLDHGVVIGAKAEAGIGAAASAEAKAGITKDMIYAEAGVKLGAGPMAGVKLFFGIK